MDARDGRDDAELVAAVLAGDREAFGPLLGRWQASVLGLCRRLLGPGPLAEDVAQEAAVAAFLGLPRLADPARFGAWLHAIAANQARMALRRRRRLALDGLVCDAGVGPQWIEPSPPPEDAWASREVHQAILAALQDLPPATRQAVVGFYLQGYSYAELAELLGTPLSTVRGRLYHGRRQLRRTLRPLADEVLTPAPTRREEQPMDTTALLDADVAFVGRLAFSTDCVVMLQERHGRGGWRWNRSTPPPVRRSTNSSRASSRWHRPPTTCSPAWSRRSTAGSRRSPSAAWPTRRCMATSP